MTAVKAALAYAARGWLVVPLHNPKQDVCSCRKKNCSSPGKHPRTEHGLKDGSMDEAQIKRWWEKWPNANLGILTGQGSGLLVLDVDGEDGKTALKALTAEHDALPKTLCVKTERTGADGKRKGCHYYFRAPGGSRYPQQCGRSRQGAGHSGRRRECGGSPIAPSERTTL
jgi:hypothetical protein